MTEQNNRVVGIAVFGICCLSAGVVIGHFFSSESESIVPPEASAIQPQMNVSLGDDLKLKLPESFFADLPLSENGRDRLVSVETFSNPYLGEMVLPTFPQQPWRTQTPN